MRFAVLEWDKDSESDYCRVIAKDCSKKTAELFIKMTPSNMIRKIVLMAEYEMLNGLRSENVAYKSLKCVKEKK